jgi:hypothetical protein
MDNIIKQWEALIEHNNKLAQLAEEENLINLRILEKLEEIEEIIYRGLCNGRK